MRSAYNKRVYSKVNATGGINGLDDALGSLHASSDMYERVLAQASSGVRQRRRGAAPKLAVVLAVLVAGVLVTGTGAYAVTNIVLGKDFFAQAFGAHGREGTTTWSVDGNDSDDFTFQRTIEPVDASQLTDEYEDAAEAVGYTVSARGYTLTIENVAMDERGSGAATFTLSNPRGIDIDAALGAPGELVFSDNSDLRLLATEYGKGTMANTYEVYDADTMSATEVHGTIYFHSFDLAATFADGVRWGMTFDGATESECYWTDVFAPEKYLSARTFTADGGETISVSPFAIVVDLRNEDSDSYNDSIEHLGLIASDGSEQVIADASTGTMNYYQASLPDGYVDGEHVVIYSTAQLLSPGDVASVRVTSSRYDSEGAVVDTWEGAFTPAGD